MKAREEHHSGEVIRIDADYTRVTLQTPAGEEYERYFETEFLRACGIRRAEEKFELVFRVTADGTSGMVSMQVVRCEGEKVEATDEELRKILASLDLTKIGEAFGSALD